MKPEESGSPQSWIKYAKSNLRLADKGGQVKGVLYEDLCFNAQQAAEKALKALCLHKEIDFPKTHSIVRLMDILEENGVNIPDEIKEGDILTDYAVQTRYPGWAEAITQEEYTEAIQLAARILFWAEKSIDQ